MVLLFIPLLLISSLNSVNQHLNGLADRFGEKLTKVNNQLLRYKNKTLSMCRSGTCLLGDVKANKKALLVGDSYAGHSKGFFDVLAKDANLKVEMVEIGACFIANGESVSTAKKFLEETKKTCSEAKENIFKRIKTGKYRYVIIAQAWDRYTRYSNFLQHQPDESIRKIYGGKFLDKNKTKNELISFIDELSKLGVKVVIVKTTYDTSYESNLTDSLNKEVSNCSKIPLFFRKNGIGCTFKPKNDDLWFDSLLKPPLLDTSRLTIIDQKEFQCTKKQCHILLNGVPIYADIRGHLTDYASYQFGKMYLEKHENPFK